MRLATAILTLLLATSLASPVAARGGRDPLSGRGEIKQKNEAEGTVVIRDRTYHVTERTRILDREGNPLPLSGLDVPEPGEKGLWEILTARFEAIEHGRELQLIELELVGPLE